MQKSPAMDDDDDVVFAAAVPFISSRGVKAPANWMGHGNSAFSSCCAANSPLHLVRMWPRARGKKAGSLG